MWTNHWYRAFAVFVGFALLYGVVSSSLTMTTKSNLPAAAPEHGDKQHHGPGSGTDQTVVGKSMYLAAGSGIPEIKTILSGFVIPHFLDLKVLLVKAVGAVFAVATGMCLGKEGPFVHISTCVAYLVGKCFPKYRENGRKMRELLSAGCSSGLSVAFGAPIGGVLFSYEVSILSLYNPRYSFFFAGNQHILPPKSPLASVLLLTLGCNDLESTQSHWHRKTRPLRDQLRNILLSNPLPSLHNTWHCRGFVGRHFLQVQFHVVQKFPPIQHHQELPRLRSLPRRPRNQPPPVPQPNDSRAWRQNHQKPPTGLPPQYRNLDLPE